MVLKKHIAFLFYIGVLLSSVNAYDFTAKSPSGHVLCYNIVDGGVEVVPMFTSTPRYKDLYGELIIPEKVVLNGYEYNVTAIGNYAFAGCADLLSVDIPTSVVRVGMYAFSRCYSLKNLVVPKSVSSIGFEAFVGVPNVEYTGNASGTPWGALKINGSYLFFDNEDSESQLLELDEDPEFPGGMEALYKYLAEKIRYPSLARDNEITGKVVVSFIVDTDGCVTNPYILHDIGGGCGDEVVRVVRLMPKWKPGKKNGRPVRVLQKLPVNFNLKSEGGGDESNSISFNISNIPVSQSKSQGNNSNANDCNFIEYTFEGVALCFKILSNIDLTCAVSSKQNEIKKNFTIPSYVSHNNVSYKVVEIDEKAFYGMSGITAVYIPNSIKKIGERAFFGCYNMTTLNVPDNVEYIGSEAFLGIEEIRYDGKASGRPWGAWNVTSRKKQSSPRNTERNTNEKSCPTHTKVATTENQIKESISKNNDGISGIYEDVSNSSSRLAVLGDGTSYNIYYLSGASNKCWEIGHVKAILRPTATTGLFKGTWYMADFSENNNCVIAFDGIKMDVVVDNQKMMFLKMYPTQQDSPIISNTANEMWSGTGWALGNGYVVTNNHVIDDARTIVIKGIGGEFDVGINAKVVATDRINDIAILKINDSHFKGYGTLSYAVSSRIADVGEDIFVLGFPLGDALGDEIKLTTGVINSRSGFGDFQNCYQIQAPITHGNSGGPLFDSKGNVIGIVVGGLNKELNLAENVGYAIKISYLKILIESAGLNITLPNKNTISNLSRPEKVKRVRKFVYYIECSK